MDKKATLIFLSCINHPPIQKTTIAAAIKPSKRAGSSGHSKQASLRRKYPFTAIPSILSSFDRACRHNPQRGPPPIHSHVPTDADLSNTQRAQSSGCSALQAEARPISPCVVEFDLDLH